MQRLGKKGFIGDAILGVVLLFVIALIIPVLYVLFSSINTSFQDNAQMDNTSKTLMNNSKDRFTNVWDYAFLTLFLGLAIALMITSYVLQSNPGMFFIILVIVSIIAGVAGYLANAFSDVMSNNTILGASSDNFPITVFILDHYMLSVIVIVFLMLIVFFAKPYSGGP